jgi:hypothetical protein
MRIRTRWRSIEIRRSKIEVRPKFHRVHAKKVQKWLVLCLGLAELYQHGKWVLTLWRSMQKCRSRVQNRPSFRQVHAKKID